MIGKTILVTGGAGFIGGHFIHRLMMYYPNYSIINVDMLTEASDLQKHQTLAFRSNYTFHHVSTMDRDAIFQLFEQQKIHYVVNFAAESHVDQSIKHPLLFTQSNVVGTQNVLDACTQFGVERFIQISTDEVYGSLTFEQSNAFTERTPLSPNSPYSASKAAADLLAHAYYKTYGLPVIITRCSNNYGPYQMPEKLIPRTIYNALQNEQIPLYGHGENVRDWLHVSDHCAAIDFILHNGEIGEVYNIGGQTEKSNLEVVTEILALLQKPTSLIQFTEDRKGHDLRYAIVPDKLSQLGWKPEIHFHEGLEQTISWYIENLDWTSNYARKLLQGSAT